MIEIKKIKKLKKETGVSLSKCKEALEKSEGDIERAKELLKETYGILAQKLKERKTKEGIIEAYVHSGKKIGSMIKLLCESDFVAKSPDFQKLAHELCLQIVAQDPKEIPLLEQNWIRDERKKVKELIEEYIAKFGENIVVEEFSRFQI